MLRRAAGARQGAELPLPGRRAPRAARARRSTRSCAASSASCRPAGSTPTSARRGSCSRAGRSSRRVSARRPGCSAPTSSCRASGRHASRSTTRETMPPADEGPFLKEERRLIDTIAERIGQLRPAAAAAGRSSRTGDGRSRAAARPARLAGHPRVPARHRPAPAPAHLAQDDQPPVLERRRGGAGAAAARSAGTAGAGDGTRDENRPLRGAAGRLAGSSPTRRSRSPREHLSEPEIVVAHPELDQGGHASSFLVAAAREPRARSLAEIANALERYQHTGVDERELSLSTQMGLRVALVRRFFSEHLDFINVAKDYIDGRGLLRPARSTSICPPRSHGKLGGKSPGCSWPRRS